MPRVLLVEDNRTFRETFKGRLRQSFPSLLIDDAEVGNKALKKVKDAPPDIVFLDMSLPDMSGLDLTRKLKKDYPYIKIAVLTSYDVPEYKTASLQAGAVGFFIKDSLNWEEIESLIKSTDQNGS